MRRNSSICIHFPEIDLVGSDSCWQWPVHQKASHLRDRGLDIIKKTIPRFVEQCRRVQSSKKPWHVELLKVVARGPIYIWTDAQTSNWANAYSERSAVDKCARELCGLLSSQQCWKYYSVPQYNSLVYWTMCRCPKVTKMRSRDFGKRVGAALQRFNFW